MSSGAAAPPALFGWLAAVWAGLVCIDYVCEPLHLLRMGQARDALRIWSEAPYSLHALLDVLPGHLAAAGTLSAGIAAAWMAGRGVAGWFGAGGAPLQLGFGLGAGSLGMFGGGLVGLWRPGVGWMGAVVLAAAGAICRPLARRSVVAAPSPQCLFPKWVGLACLVLAALSLIVNVLGACTPETGYDSLIQHLADVREAGNAGRIFFNDLTFLGQHPAGIEMLYALLLPTGGDEAAKLLHALFAVGTAWAFRSWVRRSVSSPDATLLACALYLTPFHGILSSRAYIDLGLTFYSALALLAPWGSWAQGAVLGLAIGAKYLGGFLLIGWIVALASSASAGAWRVFVAASLTAGAWGLRNWLNAGNPVYPFAYGWLGGVAWGERSASEYSAELSSYGRAGGLADGLAIPWLSVVRDKGALDDGSLGPLFLAVVPLILLVRPRVSGRPERILGWFIAAVWALWLASPRQVRYALMLLPPTLAALAPGMRRAAAAWPRGWRTASVLLPIVLLVNLEISFAAIYLWANPVYVALGMESRTAYLARVLEPRDPGTGRSLYLAVSDWLPEHLPPAARTYMLGDAKVYYLPGRWRVNALFNPPLLARIVRESSNPDEIAMRFRQRGVTHILYNVGGSIHIEYTHHLFAWTPRELGLVEEFFRRWLCPLTRRDTTEGDPMYLLFELRAGRWLDPPYLPGIDTRIAGVEEAAARRLTPDAATKAAELLRDFPASRYLGARLAPYLRRPRRP